MLYNSKMKNNHKDNSITILTIYIVFFCLKFMYIENMP